MWKVVEAIAGLCCVILTVDMISVEALARRIPRIQLSGTRDRGVKTYTIPGPLCICCVDLIYLCSASEYTQWDDNALRYSISILVWMVELKFRRGCSKEVSMHLPP